MQQDELTLAVLRNLDEIKTQKSLAEKLGLSVGKINYVIKALVDKGFIKAENFFANKNKNQYKYLLTQKGIQEKLILTEKFIARKKKEYDELVEELEKMRS
ncbi:MAG: MarR family EPS-associated transcriptional regulator [Sulfurospirillaceae bacterium]|nr:MarR family EPS-associated transcriptional regulator [Sulfurospirillaceae bacterium]